MCPSTAASYVLELRRPQSDMHTFSTSPTYLQYLAVYLATMVATVSCSLGCPTTVHRSVANSLKVTLTSSLPEHVPATAISVTSLYKPMANSTHIGN